jgi:hypothetical protein
MADVRFPSHKEVEVFHTNSDKDGTPNSVHHTLGASPNQASPGDHTHDGGTSKMLLENITLTGSKTTGDATWRNSITAALAALGALDATT